MSRLLLPLLLAVTTAAPAAPSPAFKAGVFEPPRQAPEFALRGSDGSELTLARYRGKVVLLSFGFTHCAAVCPTTLDTLARAKKALGAEGEAVQVVFVTVDPERDPPAQLKAYLAAFDPSFVGGTGKPELLAAMRKSYGVVAEKVPLGSSYAMDHTSSIFLIDREGRLRAMMPYGRDARDFVHDVKLLLAK
ncbi:MAG: SCO family protein [Burkholderiales bacterium]|nr:SCO family protein [Burkholderiales bacterium]